MQNWSAFSHMLQFLSILGFTSLLRSRKYLGLGKLEIYDFVLDNDKFVAYCVSDLSEMRSRFSSSLAIVFVLSPYAQAQDTRVLPH